jgi:hypothetical protein
MCSNLIEVNNSVDEGSIPEPRSRSSSAIYILEIESSYVKLETKPPTADPLTKMKADSSNLTNLLRTGIWKRPA